MILLITKWKKKHLKTSFVERPIIGLLRISNTCCLSSATNNEIIFFFFSFASRAKSFSFALSRSEVMQWDAAGVVVVSVSNFTFSQERFHEKNGNNAKKNIILQTEMHSLKKYILFHCLVNCHLWEPISKRKLFWILTATLLQYHFIPNAVAAHNYTCVQPILTIKETKKRGKNILSALMLLQEDILFQRCTDCI